MTAPIGGMLWALAALIVRLAAQWITARCLHRRFDAFDRPDPDFLSRSSNDEPGAIAAASANEISGNKSKEMM